MKDKSYDQGKYPQEITQSERALGFEYGLLGEYGLPNETIPPLSDAPVVLKRLNSSDVLVKILWDGEIAYSHKRFAKDGKRENSNPEWWPINDPVMDATVAIAAFDRRIARNVSYLRILIPCQYRFCPIQ